MRAVVQRTDKSKVTVGDEIVASVGRGLTVLLGVGSDDTERDVQYLADKVVNLRIFSDAAGKMNLSLLDIKGELMVISQFTLFGDCRKGKRPSFDSAASPLLAKKLYLQFIECCEGYGVTTYQGRFQADMIVSLENQGPVTILLDSKRLF